MARRTWPRLTDEQRQFAEEHHGLIYHFLNQRRLPEDEWYGIAAEAYVKAVIDFDPGKGTFSTHAYWRMGYAAMHEWRTRGRAVPTVGLDELNGRREDVYYDDLSLMDLKTILQGLSLTGRQRKVLLGIVQEACQYQIAAALKASNKTIQHEQQEIRRLVREALQR